MKLIKHYLAIGILCLATPALAAVQEFHLANGLRVLVKEDHRAPIVVSQVWYRAGSLDEFNGTTGVAHVLEHMMFKGTRDVPDGQFSRLIAAAGGRENAFTSRDHTAYFEQLQKDRLGLALKLEADRMHNLILSDADFAKEIQVVMEERRMRTDDKPQALVYEQLMATAFQESPYRRPVIGWMNDLQHMTVNDARDWYQRWYAPNNATLVVVGDVQADAVKQLAERYFGPIPARLLAPRKPQPEPAQTGIKRVTVKAPAKLPYLIMAYHAPVLRDVDKDWEPYALQVLAAVLDGGDAARLTRNLVRAQRVASAAGADYDAVARGPGLFLLDGTPSEGKTAADLEAALRAQIELIKRDGVSADELKRVKAQVIASDVYQRDSTFYQAMQLGEYATAGLPVSEIEARVKKLQAVTPEQVRDVARKYLVDDELTVATLDPQPFDNKPPRPDIPEMRHTGGELR
ncbi:zinc protease [Sulfuriferula plumbiphila]|uniref:Zinc protease n=1 Tax=Sulfuriferula plumbiphila TaxID=171865 RepID=A0A512L721_9PROT|nr:pitrilysin family protein [Sulfuriferula plumbiphila]BBP02881.1 zinc protease [Sulfuriferula plumbiphila]GEP30252.1 zinc protease [Sulfuriferula plumbiphila]